MGSSIDLAAIGTKLSNEDATFHRGTVADLLQRRSLHFPGGQPVSFARHHLNELEDTDYFVCEKTDGIRLLLYLTQFVDEQGTEVEMQLLIDRKNDYYCIPIETLHIPVPGPNVAEFHRATLLDGELVRQKFPNGKARLCFLIFDALAVDRENVCEKPFAKRLQRIMDRIWKPYKDFSRDPRFAEDIRHFPFELEMKSMERPYAIDLMFNERIPNLPHGNDGLIFTCVNTPYVSGTDQHILKWKPPQENTIDFKLQIGEFPTVEDEDGSYPDYDAIPDIELLVSHGSKQYEYFAMLHLTAGEWNAMKSMNQMFDHRIIECFRDPETAQWRPKLEDDGTPRFRDDKTDGNHISVVQSVLQSIQDAVTEQDLKSRAGAIRTAFKAREALQLQAAKQAQLQAQAQQKAEREKREAAKVAAQAQQQKLKEAEQSKMEIEDDGPTYDDDY
nr:mrna-capping enzyme subunit alpha [Quercus suber]